jgi:sulfite exporter TauE/SafE
MTSSSSTRRDYAATAAIVVILTGIYFAAKQFYFLPFDFEIPETMGYGLVFLVGLVASFSTCVAVTGGLLLAASAKYNEANPQLDRFQRFRPHVFFNVGRVLSYTLFGGLIGALGAAISLSPMTSGIIALAASAMMILFGLQMLGLLPSLGRFQPRASKTMTQSVKQLAGRGANSTAFAFGAVTFFLPCGFTQALQLYVLAKGDFAAGALTMLAFSLGTLPALLSISALSSFVGGVFQPYFIRIAGVALIALGAFNIQYGLVLTGGVGQTTITAENAGIAQSRIGGVRTVGGKQIANMKVVGLEYQPNRFAVDKDIPVEWRIEAKDAEGCGRFLVIPKLRISKLLSSTETTVITFVPRDIGDIEFNCGMRMMTPGSKFVVTPKAS